MPTYLRRAWKDFKGHFNRQGYGVGIAAAVLGGTFLWQLVCAPHRLLRDEVNGLSTRTHALEGTAANALAFDSLRVGLFAVRTELASCATRITESLEKQRWWNPDVDPLPGGNWNEHFAALSDPRLPSSTHQQIEGAYQKCNRLNHRIRGYIAEYKDSHFAPFPSRPAGIYQFRDGDEAEIRECLKKIEVANTAITHRVDGGQG